MFSNAQFVRFQEWYDNFYIFLHKDVVIDKWLSLHHPEALPDDVDVRDTNISNNSTADESMATFDK